VCSRNLVNEEALTQWGEGAAVGLNKKKYALNENLKMRNLFLRNILYILVAFSDSEQIFPTTAAL
jgi:hypothetical protein